MEAVLVPGTHHHLAFEDALAQRAAHVVALVRDDTELAVLERDGDGPVAELRFAQRRALEVIRDADVDPVRCSVHGTQSYALPYTWRDERHRTSHHGARHLAPAALPAAALHHLVAGSRQRRLRQAADEQRSRAERDRLRSRRGHLLPGLRGLRDP